MREPEDKEIYNLFKARLTDTNNIDPNSEEHWEGMEELLDGKSQGKIVVIRFDRIAAGIAAMLLLFTYWPFLKPVISPTNPMAGAIVEQTIKSPEQRKVDPESGHEIAVPVNRNKLSKDMAFYPVSNKAIHKNGGPYPGKNTASNPLTDSAAPISLDLGHHIKASIPALALTGTVSADSVQIPQPALSDKNIVRKISPNISTEMHGLTLAISAAPDINSVNGPYSRGQLGTGLGVQLSYKLNKRLSITTGATYAIKPYETNMSNYRDTKPGWWAGSSFAALGKPDKVTANCKVLDIPLNLNYQLVSKGNNNFMIGAGLSSYFMLQEAYRFDFASEGSAPANFQVNNQNQHVLGVLNLDATWERRINSRFGVLIQPYAKLPLTRIGFGQVDLRSTGVALGVTWNINSFKMK